MKTINSVTLSLALAATGICAQTANSGQITGDNLPSPTPYQIVSSGPNFNVWQWQTFEPLPNGQVGAHTHSYTELASGLNYEDQSNGQWVPAQELIQPYSQGAIAQSGQARVIYANNLNTAGAVDEETPDGNRLVSNILGLMYDDPATGQTVQIAEIQDSAGQLIAANQVLYTNAFEGVNASVRFTYRRDGTEQDVILAAQPPPPEAFGLRSDTAELVVVTEFLSPPDASVIEMGTDATGTESDEAISWGATSLGQGKAFSIGGADSPASVCKQYLNINGRYFLFEKVKYRDIQASLSSLPLQASNSRRLPGMASRHFSLPKTLKAKHAAGPMRLALGQMPDKGYVLDYVSLNVAYTNYLFQGDTTYYVSGSLTLYGTNYFEGGTVIKYTNNASINIIPSTYQPGVVWKAGSYRPVVMTSKDDNTVGQSISGSTGNPTGFYANPALGLVCPSQTINISSFRISYAQQAVSLNSSTNYTFMDGQICSCNNGFTLGGGAGVAVKSVLFDRVQTDFNQLVSDQAAAENCTFNGSSYLSTLQNVAQTTVLSFTNCLFASVTNLQGTFTNLGSYTQTGSFNGFYATPEFGGNAVTNTFYPFQTVGAGKYYLTSGCVFTNAGTTSISLATLTDIAGKTTYGPMVFSNVTFSVATNFGPQVPRDTNSAPTLGYHYDPLDYAFSGVTVYSNITFSAGTAVGWFELPNSGGAGYGLAPYDKVVLSFNGTASLPCTIARYCTVQEGGDGLWKNLGYMGAIVAQSLSGGYSMNPTNAALTRTTFTRHALLAEGPNHYRENTALSQVAAQNSEFWGGDVGAYWDYLNATNCLFDRVAMGVGGGNRAQWWMRNCTMHGGSLTLSEFNQTWPVWIEECAFDGTSLAVDNNSGGNTNETYCDFNAFLTNNTVTNVLSAPGTHNVNVTNFNWQSSRYGNFYLLPNSHLIDHGSTTADKFGLYHFTTQTNQMKETNSLVDIDYHYVAVDTNGNPIDTNGDGIPDYLQNPEGDGIDHAGETPWDLGIATQPKNLYVVQGQDAPFSVTASGISPFTYQWQSNGVAIAGATNSNLTLYVAVVNDEANYSVVVSNWQASVTSSNAALWVATPVGITNQPVSVTNKQGANVSFSVGASGNHLVYQWLFNNTPLNNGSRISGATNSTLTISTIAVSDAGNYTVTVTNLFVNVSSSIASLTVVTNPWIATNPVSATNIIQSDDVSFSVTVNGSGLNYQWWLTNSLVTNAIPNATNSVYTKLVVTTNDAGNYSVIVTNLAGTTNANASLTVLVPPWITSQPASITNNQGSNVTFSVSAFGTTNLYYQWFKNLTNVISSATSSSLTLTNIQSSDAAGYSCLVTNIAGTNMSATAWLSVVLTGGGTTNGWGPGNGPPSFIPSVSMFSPTNTVWTNAAVFPYGPPISIRALASSKYSYITNVAFYFTGTNYGTNFIFAGNAVPGRNTKFALAWTNALPGTNILKARAWDCSGQTNDSTNLIYVIMTQPPSNSVESITNLVWTEGSASTNIVLYSTLFNDGQPYSWVTNVQWTNININGNAQYVSIANPHSFTPLVTFTTNGTYQLQLEVDNGYATNTQICTVNIERRPFIYFNWPTNNAQIPLGTVIELNATATSQGSSIANVTFYTNSALLGTGTLSTNSTYKYAWYNAPVWTNVISAVATDNNGLTNIASVTNVVVPPLAVWITSPANNQLFVISPTNVWLLAQPVSYVGSTATGVVFTNVIQAAYIGTGTLNYTNYQFLWQDVTNGTYTVSATARDNSGNAATNAVTFTLNAMPSVVINVPTNDQTFLEVTNVKLTATASDSDGNVTNVQFFVYSTASTNSLGSFATNVPQAVCNFVWTNRYHGWYQVVAVATDNRGASSVSPLAVFQVTQTNPPPFVQITYPTNNAAFADGSDITIMATAYGTNGGGTVTNVEFYANGQLLGSTPYSPYSMTICCWKTGEYTLVARATDSLGGTAVSTNTVTINIGQPTPEPAGYWDPQFSNPFVATSYGPVAALKAADTNLYALGFFLTTYWPPSSTLSVLEMWNRVNWSDFFQDSSATFNGAVIEGVHALELNNSMIYMGVEWGTSQGTNNYVIEWNGTNVSNAGNFLFGPVYALHAVGGQLYAGGNFTAAGNNTNVQRIARLDTVSNIWVQVGNGITNGAVYAIADIGNRLYIGGSFTNAGGNPNANYIAELVGNVWTNLGAGIGSTNSLGEASVVRALTACKNDLYVGGSFVGAGNSENADGIAKWDGQQWSSIGNGVDDGIGSGTAATIYSISARGDTIFVGGDFVEANTVGTNTVPANNIAEAIWSEDSQQWTWSGLDGGVSGGGGIVYSTAIMEGNSPNAFDLYVGGDFTQVGSLPLSFANIARWRFGTPYPTNAPAISIISPVDNTVFTNPASINLVALATAADSNLLSVAFSVDGLGVSGGTYTVSNLYSGTWNTPTPGLHLLAAVATDDTGLANASKPVVFTVIDTNQNQTVTLKNDLFTVFANSPPTVLPVLTNDLSSGGPLTISQASQEFITAYGSSVVGTVSVSFDGNDLVFTPLPNRYGTNLFTYTATNAAGGVGVASVTVYVRCPPVVQILSPDCSNCAYAVSPTNVAISGSAFDWDGQVTNVALFVGGSFFGQTTSTNFLFNFSTNTPGFYSFVAVATDNDGYTNTSLPVTIAITNNFTATNRLTAAISNLVVTYSSTAMATPILPVVQDGLFDLKGAARDSNTGDAVAYQLLLHPATNDDVIIANVTPQPRDSNGFHQGTDNNGDLGTNDFTGIANGTYDLELIVHGGGAQTNCITTFQLNSQLKIGQFSFSEQDLVLPVNGIPLTVTRTYNSLNPLSSDFGYSWSFALNDMDVQLDDQREDVTIGTDEAPFDEDAETGEGLPKIVNIRTGGDWDVTLTLPDGRRVTFAFDPYYSGDGSGNIYAQWKTPPGLAGYTPQWQTPLGSSGYTLTPEVTGSDLIQNYPLHWADSDLWLGDAPIDNHDFPGWKLKTPDGTLYHITRGTAEHVTIQDLGNPGQYAMATVYGPPKLTKIQQRTGDSIFIGDTGITNYDAATNLTRSVLFQRDSAGRITALFDPNAGANGLPAVQYVYNQDTGNLIQVLKLVDRNAGIYVTNKYDYNNQNFPHYITSIENGDGVPVAQNYYDNSGHLTAVKDASGNLTQFVHNLTNDMDVVIDRLNHTNTYVYDTHGNITAQTNALSQVTLMAYDQNNNKTNEVVFFGNVPYATNSYVYDQTLNVMLSSTDPLGHTSSFTYDPTYGLLLTSTDARGNPTTNNYDQSTGELISTVDALGDTNANSYDSNGQLVTLTDPIGTTTWNFYDSFGNVTGMATIAADGVTILNTNTFAYDPNGNRTNSTVWRRVNNTWTPAATVYVYDAMNRVVQTVNPDGGMNTVVYDATGKQSATIDPLGNTNSFIYDYQGRLTQTKYPDGSTELSSYDAAGNRTNSVDRANRVTTYVYDGLNRLTNTIYADATTNSTIFDGVGRVAQTIDARGTIIAFAYDAAGRRLVVTNAFGTTVAMTNYYGYDANGNQTTFTDSLGRTTTNVFDVLNRQVQTLYPDSTASSTVYDGDGRHVAETNQDGIVTLFGYDGSGRLTSVTNALSKTEQMITRYQFDAAGNETAQIDALGRTNLFACDGMGRRVSHTMPGGQSEGFAYDLDGNQLYQTNFNGAVITNQFDVLNRLIKKASLGGYRVTFAYSATGQRTNMVDPSGTTAYLYDLRDRLTNKAVLWNGGTNVNLSYAYDASGNMTNLASSTSGGVALAYSYDPLNRLTNVLNHGNNAAAYNFDGVGNLLTMRYGTMATNAYQYDSLNRLTNLACTTVMSGNVASFYYQLGLTGNRTNLIESVNGFKRTNSWSYDSLYRLVNEIIKTNGGNSSLGYSYDSVGNRLGRTIVGSNLNLTNQTFTFNTNDWLNTDKYDSNGNTTNASGNAYQYDAMNHVTNVNNTIFITYDGDGNRVSKKVGGTTTYYLLDDRNPSGYAQVLEEWTSTGTPALSRVYNYGVSLISQRQPNMSTNYFVYDGHGSTRVLLDTGGNVVNTFAYDAYGTLIASSAASQTAYLYCGQQLDSDVGLYYNRARYLNVNTGRLLTMDTYGGNSEDPLSLHKYLYGADNPVDKIDPSGHMTADELKEKILSGGEAAMEGVKDALQTIATGGENAEALSGGLASFGVALIPDMMLNRVLNKAGIAAKTLEVRDLYPKARTGTLDPRGPLPKQAQQENFLQYSFGEDKSNDKTGFAPLELSLSTSTAYSFVPFYIQWHELGSSTAAVTLFPWQWDKTLKKFTPALSDPFPIENYPSSVWFHSTGFHYTIEVYSPFGF